MSDSPQHDSRLKRFTDAALPILVDIASLTGPGGLIIDLTRSRTSLEKRIEHALTSIQETSRVVADLEKSLSERTAKLKRLQADYERYSQLAELEEEKARAIIDQLGLTLDQRSGRERWIGFAINLAAGLIFFVAGIFLGPTIQDWLGLPSP